MSRGVMPCGLVRYGDLEKPKGVEWPYHVAGLGATRRGKTVWTLAPFLNQVLPPEDGGRGEGGVFFDPTGQAITYLKRFLGGRGTRERVVEITREGGSPQPSWNLLDMSGVSAEEAEAEIPRRLSAITDMMVSVQGWSVQNNGRAINLTRSAVETLLELARVLPHDCQPTIFQIPRLLTDHEWRRRVLERLRPSLSDYWHHEYASIGKDAAPPVTHLLRLARSEPSLRALLGSSESTFDFRSAIEDKQIVLACLGAPGVEQKFLANLLLFSLVRSLFARGNRNEPRFVYILDELLTYDGAVGSSVCDLLEQTAKFGGVGFFVTQNLLRLKRESQIALLTNRSMVVATTSEDAVANMVGASWKGADPEILTDLPPYNFVVDVEVQGSRRQFLMKSLPPERLYRLRDAAVPRLDAELASKGRPAAAVTADLETLDQRISDALESVSGPMPEIPRPRSPRGQGVMTVVQGGG